MAGRSAHLFVIAALVLGALLLAGLSAGSEAPHSPLEWLQYPLLLAVAWGFATAAVDAPGPARATPVMALSWALGMVVELTLTVDGSGIGGVRPDTRTSFLLAQGDYIPLAILIWACHRRLGCQMAELGCIAAGIALTEGIVFTGSIRDAAASGSVVGTVLVSCYLITIYLAFLVLPFRLCGIGRGRVRAVWPGLVALGFAGAFGVRLFWGLVYSPAVTALFDLPAAAGM